jgi:hypothetical protein
MGDSVANFDRAIDENNLLRLAVSKRVVKHLGNTIDKTTVADLPDFLKDPDQILSSYRRKRPSGRVRHIIFEWKPIKRVLLGIYDRIFRLYFGMRQ